MEQVYMNKLQGRVISGFRMLVLENMQADVSWGVAGRMPP